MADKLQRENKNGKQNIVFGTAELKEEINQRTPVWNPALANRILNSAYGTNTDENDHRKYAHRRKRFSPVPGKLAIVLIAAALLTIGTVFATNYDVLSRIFSNPQLIQRIDQISDRHGDISLVVDSIVNNEDGCILVASLVNEGPDPWDSQMASEYYGNYLNMILWRIVEVEAAEVEEPKDLAEHGSIDLMAGGYTVTSPPVLSQDGRRLTFVQERYVNDPEGSQYAVSLDTFHYPSKIAEKEINVPLAELYEANGITLDDPNFEQEFYHIYKDLLLKLDDQFRLELNDDMRGIPYIGAAIVDLPESKENKGLYLFTETEYMEHKDGITELSKYGLVTEIKNLETGEKIKMSGSGISANGFDDVFVSIFSEITDPSTLSQYAATQITYYETGKIEAGWNVSFVKAESQERRIVNYQGKMPVGYGEIQYWPDATDESDGFANVTVDFYINPMGVTIRGIVLSPADEFGSLDDMYMLSRHAPSMQAVLKDGTVEKMNWEHQGPGNQGENSFVFEYHYERESDALWEYKLVDPIEIDCILFNGERIDFRD